MSLDAMKQALELICSARLCEVNSMSSRQEMLRLMSEAADTLRAAIDHAERPMTHSADCWRWHHACARAWIERAEKQDWDWRHPKAQALIGAKARLEIKLRLIEQLVDDPSFEPTASDTEFWEPLHDKLNDKLNERLAQPRQWQGLTDEELRQAYCEVSGKEWCLGGLANAHTFYEAIEAKLKEKNG